MYSSTSSNSASGPESYPVVFAPHSWGLSHVGRSLLVAQELARRGRRCVFVGDGPFVLPEDSLVRLAGIEVHPLVDMPMEKVLVNGFDFHTPESLRRLVSAEREAIAKLRPAVIVSDYRPSVHVAAAIERVPVIALTNTHWTHYWGTKISPPLEHAVTIKITRLLGQTLGMALLRPLAPRIAARIFVRNAAIYNELLAEHGLPPQPDILRLFEGSLATYLTDAPEWCRTKPDLPPQVRVAGPLFWSAPAPEAWDEGIPADKPWIYLSTGSSVNPDIFPALYRELGGLPYRIVMTTAGIPLPTGLPDNFTVREFLPGAEVMRRSVLSILNGGSGTIYQAIAARTPLLLVAMRGDQEWNGHDAERLGIGRAIHRRQVIDDPGYLRRAIEETMAAAPDFRRRLDRLAEQIDRYDAAKTIADGVEAAHGHWKKPGPTDGLDIQVAETGKRQ